MSKPIQDTIDFYLSDEKTVVNTTVKITATISGIISPDVAEDTIMNSVRDMTSKFIDAAKHNAKWNFSGTTRSKHASGNEELRITATIRVPETEFYALDERAEAVAVKGLMKISNIAVDTAPPQYMIDETESDLRVALLMKATKELEKINSALRGEVVANEYRLGQISFQANQNYSMSNTTNRHAMMAMAAAPSYGDAGGGASQGLGNAVKLTMTATIVFRKDH